MKPTKLFMDVRPGEQPENTYPYAKNGIQQDLLGTTSNEPGFKKMAAVIPYSVMGVIETDHKPIIFSTNNVNSAIGYFNPETGAYEAIVNDTPGALVNWPANGQLLGFSTDNYITGESERNYKGELIIAFTDKSKFPKYLNCDNPGITKLDDLRLFPYYSPPKISLSESMGGSLAPGSYYVSVHYEKNDGTQTPRSEVSQGITVSPGAMGLDTDKAILISITDPDLSFDYLRISVISKVKGVTKAVLLLDPVPVAAGVIDILYTGDNLTEDLTVAEVLTPPATYERVGTMGQLNGALYIADLDTEPALDDLQPYASVVRLEWVSERIDATSPPVEHKTGKKKSLMHEEVYAMYIRYHRTRGGFTKAFHIPGLAPSTSARLNSQEALIAGSGPTPTFKVEDTIPSFNAGAKTGAFGFWENDVEEYPDDPSFDARILSGPDLRGKKVRHHRTPSLRWCSQNLYNSDPLYGKTHLDLLGVKASNVIIPAKYQGIIDGYEILYAKRTPSNMTNYGQGTLQHAFAATDQRTIPTGNALLYSTGGNWEARVDHQDRGDYNDNFELTSIRKDTFRVNPFDILLNKPSISPTFLSAQYRLRRTLWSPGTGGLFGTGAHYDGYLEDGNISGERTGPTVHLVDYTLGDTPKKITQRRSLRKIKESFYLAQGTSVNRMVNMGHENTFAGILEPGQVQWDLENQAMGYVIRGRSYTNHEKTARFEESYVVNLLALKADVYSSFYSQRLVSMGDWKPLADSQPFWGGDTFLCDYTFHTYGRHDKNDLDGDGIRGIKVIRRFVCESSSNIHLRYEIPGNEYSKWYPRTGVAQNNPAQCYITHFDRSKDPNQFGYTKDLNALNDFVSSTIYSSMQEEINKFPYRIHRGGKLSRQSKARSWRSFLPLDFYEAQKNMGRIINVTGMDDKLIIHHEHALFLTQDKAKLDAGALSVTLGTGDIFQFEPQEAQSAKHGYAGTRHDLACVKTPVGYAFVDARMGEVYLLKGKLVNLNEGVNTFLRQYLKLEERNVYTGNGVTIGWDQKYKRLLLTVKNGKPATGNPVIKLFAPTAAFYSGLVPGDIVNYNGRYIQYQGLNNPLVSGFDCPIKSAAPPQFAWEKDLSICEQDAPLTEIPHLVPDGFTYLSSPAALLWDDVSQKLYVGDYDNTTGNFYHIHPTNGIKTYFGEPETLYEIIADTPQRKFYASGLSGGLKIFDIALGQVTTVAYGTDVALSRKGLWLHGDTIIARDNTSNTLNFIDKLNYNLIGSYNPADFEGGLTYLNGEYQLLSVEDCIWVIPTVRSEGKIAIYTEFFGELLYELETAAIPVSGWGGDFYRMNAYHDAANNKVYIHDSGTSQTFIYNATNYALEKTISHLLVKDTENVSVRFIEDPIKQSLYLCTSARQTDTGAATDHRVYVVDRPTGNFLRVFMNTNLTGPLTRQGSTPYLWAPLTGKRSWDGGYWASDGELIKYAH